jgi:RNA polymerase sigma-70 factor (ECF subfamily)
MGPAKPNDEDDDLLDDEEEDGPDPQHPRRRKEDRGEEFVLPEGFENDETAKMVARAKGGDVDALNDLFAHYHSVMVEVARRRIGPRLRLKEDPQDLAQTTFREAARDFSRYEYRGPGSLLRWLIQILQNKIRDKAEFYSAGKRDTSRETALDAPYDPSGEFTSAPEPPSPDLSVTRMVQRDERFRLLRDALGQLTPEYREAIALVFFEGLTLREAGERMGGRSEDALRMMLRRAERKLGDILKRTHGDL